MSTIGSQRSKERSLGASSSRSGNSALTTNLQHQIKAPQDLSEDQIKEEENVGLDRITPISTAHIFEDSLSENGISAIDALLSKIRNSIYLDYSEEKNRVRFRNQFMNHVRDVYRKMILKEDFKIPRIEKLDEEGNWSGGAAVEIKSSIFADIEYNLTREIENNKRLRDPKPVEDIMLMIANKMSRDYTLDIISSKYLREVDLSSSKVQTIDSEFTKLCKNLEILGLSFNKLEALSRLPPNIYGVNAYSCNISKSIPLASFENLIHLGLGYNRLSDLSFLNDCSQLASLDVSFNDLNNLENTVTTLSRLKKLISLTMQGNCFCMFENYRGAIFSNIPQVKILDNEEFNEERRKRYIELFKGFDGEKKSKIVVSLSPLSGLNFDEEIKLIDDGNIDKNVNGKKTPIKRAPSAKKKTTNSKKPAEVTFIKCIYYVVKFLWPENPELDAKKTVQSNPIYLPDPDPKSNTRLVSLDFKDVFEFVITEKSIGVKHHLEKPLSFYVERVVANIQEDDETNRTELSRDLLGILFAKFHILWERGFTLPDPIPDDDESAKNGDELKALMKNQYEHKSKLQNDISTESQSNLTFGTTISQPSEIWDNYEKDWKDPKKRKQAKANALKSKKLSEQDINIYRLMFEKIDSDKSGTIDRTELFSMMKELTDGKISETDVDAMMKDADSDQDGRIDFEEFVKQMEKF